MLNRNISKIYDTAPNQGFLGEGHTAISVIDGQDFSDTDPFILLMDDRLELTGEQAVGGAHPHAGFETVTLILEGDSSSGDKNLQAGDMEWLTAGSGIVHTEEITKKVTVRFLQLWLSLPKDKHSAEPKLQELNLQNIPIFKNDLVEARIYSGSSQNLKAPTHNQTPATIVDFHLQPNAEVTQEIPASYNGFIYVTEGAVIAGEEESVVKMHQVGWLDRPSEKGASQIKFRTENEGSRFIFYSGEPQEYPIYHYGPFVGNNQADIARAYNDYSQGKMTHVRNLPSNQIVRHPPVR